jgi:hypothetical protein
VSEAERTFEEDLEADVRFERGVFVRGILILLLVVALVVVRQLLLP